MRIYRRGAFWHFEFEHDGKRYRASTKSKNQRVAGQIASAEHIKILKGESGLVERRKAPWLGEAMSDFLTWSIGEHREHPRTALRYEISSKALLRYFGNATALDKITTADVEGYKAVRAQDRGQRTGRLLRPATVNRELACLRAMFNHAIRSHPQLYNPVSRTKLLAEDNQQERVVSYTEQSAYLAAATPILRDVAGLIFELGLRPEEVTTLTRAQIDLAHNHLRILKGKTPSARRRIDLTPEAHRILKIRLSATAPAPSAFLFPCETDAARPLPKVNNAHDRAVRDSAVAPFKLYAARHTFATRCAEAGIDLLTLAALLGHSRITMVQKYAHVQQEHKASAIAKLAAHNEARAAQERALREISELGNDTAQ